MAGVLLLLSACGGPTDAAPETSASTPEAQNALAAGDAQPCAGADVELADARREAYPELVADAMDDKVEPEAVQVDRFMGIGTWSAVYASTPIADPGWFVFESADGRQRFKDVWGGMADEGDRQGLAEWATGLGAPADFAACFAETVIN